MVLVQRKGRQPRRRESYFEEAGRAVSGNLEANLFFMTSIEDATKENDEFWRDIASDLVEFHGVGAKGELNHNYGLHLSAIITRLHLLVRIIPTLVNPAAKKQKQDRAKAI